MIASSVQFLGETTATSATVAADHAAAIADPWLAFLAALIGALAWPLAVFVLALIYREPIVRAVPALLTRLTAVSFHEVKIELLTTSVSTFEQVAVEFRTLDATVLTTSASPGFSAIMSELRGCDYVVVDVGVGKSWLVSRLLIFTFLMARTSAMRYVVFVRPEGGRRGVFVGYASAEDVVREILRRCPWMQRALAEASAYGLPLSSSLDVEAFSEPILPPPLNPANPQAEPPEPYVFDSKPGHQAVVRALVTFSAMEPSLAQSIASNFVISLQAESDAGKDQQSWQRVRSWNNASSFRFERSPLVDTDVRIVRTQFLQQRRIVREQGLAEGDLARTILSDGEGPVTAVTDQFGVFRELADRAAMLQQLAQTQARSSEGDRG